MYMSFASVWITLPKTEAPTSFESSPERRTASRTTVAANSVGGMSFSEPPYFPTAVRTALKITTSRCLFILPSPLPSPEVIGGRDVGERFRATLIRDATFVQFGPQETITSEAPARMIEIAHKPLCVC